MSQQNDQKNWNIIALVECRCLVRSHGYNVSDQNYLYTTVTLFARVFGFGCSIYELTWQVHVRFWCRQNMINVFTIFY
jgi:hypothetical protein